MKTVDDYDLTKLSQAIERRSKIQESWAFLLPMLKRFCKEHPNDQELGEELRKLVEK